MSDEKKDTYNFSSVEKKWQKYWKENKTFKTLEDDNYPKDKRKYLLDMLPYPSGNGLHVGHPEGYTATDILTRYYKMNGCNVLHPMGFDSFGLPAEQHAIKSKEHPKTFTQKNIEKFTQQLESIGFAYDWDRVLSTHDEKYYRWTQFLFLKLYEKGLAYCKEIPVWFCPETKTVLSNEEVVNTDKGTLSIQGGYQVFKKPLKQWILKITEYAQSLLDGLDEIDWPENVKAMQRNWIGKSQGAVINFKIENSDSFLSAFTTRLDTIFGCSYIVLAPEHSEVEKLTSNSQKEYVKDYINQSLSKSDLVRTQLQKEKSGVFLGTYAVNPFNGKKIPIYIGDYVLASYGTGCVMGVPAHDERDFLFAKKYNLPIVQVITDEKKDESLCLEKAFVEDGFLINSDIFDGLSSAQAREKMADYMEQKSLGSKQTNYKLRDWIFSRQRYWGEPIPILEDSLGNYLPLGYDELPLTLPQIQEYLPSEDGRSPLARLDEFVNFSSNGKSYKRETNTMPQWAGSCWYFIRYLDPKNENEFASKKSMEYWLPVDIYIGGTEHAVLHLLYARFWCHVFYDMGLIPVKEPFKKLVNQGMITAFAYKNNNTGKILPVDEVFEKDGKFFEIESSLEVERITTKMSKSLKNVVNPDDVIKQYGADSLRLHEMFLGPLTMSKPWDTNAITGVYKFINRVYKLKDKILEKDSENVERLLHKTIKNVDYDTKNLSFNVAISHMMTFVNECYLQGGVSLNSYKNLILILSPYAPHLCEEIWMSFFNEDKSIFFAKYPSYDDTKTYDTDFELVIQINGKLRSKLSVKKGLSNQELEAIALGDEKIKTNLQGHGIKKIIVIKDKLVNIVI